MDCIEPRPSSLGGSGLFTTTAVSARTVLLRDTAACFGTEACLVASAATCAALDHLDSVPPVGTGGTARLREREARRLAAEAALPPDAAPPRSALLRAARLSLTHAFEVEVAPPQRAHGLALFATGSLLNHSCAPNAE